MNIEQIKPEQVSTPEQQPEQVSTPEQQPEQVSTPEQQPEQVSTPEQTTQTTPIAPTTTQDTSNQDIVLENVENILSKGLDDVFLSMDQATQIKFKTEGEKAAKEIAIILQKTKFKVKEIINVIFRWLRIIPQINKYYIEQEAKIKADVIMELYKNNK